MPKSFLTLWLFANLFILVQCTDMSQNIRSSFENVDSQNNVMTKLSRQRRASAKKPPCIDRLNCCHCRQMNTDQVKTSKLYLFKDDLKVECDMITNGGGWTVIQKRDLTCGPLDFNRKWTEYEKGFGAPGYSFWLGLERIQKITAADPQIIKFEMESFDPAKGKAFAIYNHFSLSAKDRYYTLDIRDYDVSSTAGDSMLNPAYSQWNVNGMNFSANDIDNDPTSWIHCAKDYQGGWWFKDCVDGYPNGIHHESKTYDYNAVTWPSFDSYYSLRSMKISIRHKDKSRCGI